MSTKYDAQALVVMAVVGIIAGWLASMIVGGGGGLVPYLVKGVIGSFVGGFILNTLGLNLGIKNALINQIATSTIGAIVVVILARIVA